ncbi:MAG: prolyl oligopeptidase family serine peptidase [Saprospiraceae bacterium]|nr:prolyl oligopeptidase family serine peptidase [Saprospiraceae bacterium]
MLAQKGYIVACVDNRGTGARGQEFRKMTYLQLGKYETIDQIEAAKYLGKLPYADASRIGIFGWSYGGYMSSLCLLKGNDNFQGGHRCRPLLLTGNGTIPSTPKDICELKKRMHPAIRIIHLFIC